MVVLFPHCPFPLAPQLLVLSARMATATGQFSPPTESRVTSAQDLLPNASMPNRSAPHPFARTTLQETLVTQSCQMTNLPFTVDA